MARVHLKLKIPEKYEQLLKFSNIFKELNEVTIGFISTADTWDEVLTLATDAKTKEELKQFGFAIGKSAYGRGRLHQFSEKIEEFINTFSEQQEQVVYSVYLRKYSPQFEVPTTKPKNRNQFDGEISISRCVPPRSSAMSYGVLKRVSEQDHGDKPVKSSRLCEAPRGTSADNLEKSAENAEMDDKESNASSDLLKVQGETGRLSVDDFNDNLGENYGAKDQEGIKGEFEEAQDESSVQGGVLGESASGNYCEVADGKEFSNVQEEDRVALETKNEIFVGDVINDKNPQQINSVISPEKATEIRIYNLHKIGTIVKESDDSKNSSERHSNNSNEKDGTIVGGIGVADGQLNENSGGANKETSNQRGVDQIMPKKSTVIRLHCRRYRRLLHSPPPVLKQEGEDDDIQIIKVVNKRDGRPTVKPDVEVENLNAQEDKSTADVNTSKAANISKQQKFEGAEMEGKSKFLVELKSLSNDEYKVFKKELKQLGKSRSVLRKAKCIFAFFFEYAMSSKSLQEFTDKVQNKMKDSEVREITEEIKRLRNKRELRNIFSEKLRLFLMDSFC